MRRARVSLSSYLSLFTFAAALVVAACSESPTGTGTRLAPTSPSEMAVKAPDCGVTSATITGPILIETGGNYTWDGSFKPAKEPPCYYKMKWRKRKIGDTTWTSVPGTGSTTTFIDPYTDSCFQLELTVQGGFEDANGNFVPTGNPVTTTFNVCMGVTKDTAVKAMSIGKAPSTRSD